MQQNGQFILMNRDEFKKWLMATTFTRKVRIIQEHHTAIPGYKDFNGSNHFSMLLGMKSWHMTPVAQNGPGMSDIAQNLTIFPDGLIAVCRSFEKSPAGIYGVNTDALCIENVGYFDKSQDTMSLEQKDSIIFVTAMLCIKYGLAINTNSIIYHHWFDLSTGRRLDYGTNPASGSTKSCPGSNFFGGNTVAAANATFIPLVQAAYNKLTYVPKYFNDEQSIASWAQAQVFALKDLGIVKGDDLGNFNPQQTLTREAMAVLIYNFLKASGVNIISTGGIQMFNDDAKISTWAKTAVYELQKAGIIKGDSNGNLNPQDPCSREVASVLIYNALKLTGKI